MTILRHAKVALVAVLVTGEGPARSQRLLGVRAAG